MQGSIKSHTFRIYVGIIWGSCELLEPIIFAQLFYYFVIKWSALIIMDTRWYAIGVESSVYQCFCSCFCLLVWCDHWHCKIGIYVCHDEDVFISIFAWVQGGRIQAKHGHWIFGNNWSLFHIRICIRTCSLFTPFTHLYPIGYIVAHHDPVEPFSYKNQCLLSSLMTILVM